MKHSIRQRVINSIGLPVVKTETVFGELGSGVFDKNGKEIFEGDKIKIGDSAVEVVEFDDGYFYTDRTHEELVNFDSDDIEIIGHVDD